MSSDLPQVKTKSVIDKIARKEAKEAKTLYNKLFEIVTSLTKTVNGFDQFLKSHCMDEVEALKKIDGVLTTIKQEVQAAKTAAAEAVKTTADMTTELRNEIKAFTATVSELKIRAGNEDTAKAVERLAEAKSEAERIKEETAQSILEEKRKKVWSMIGTGLGSAATAVALMQGLQAIKW